MGAGYTAHACGGSRTDRARAGGGANACARTQRSAPRRRTAGRWRPRKWRRQIAAIEARLDALKQRLYFPPIKGFRLVPTVCCSRGVLTPAMSHHGLRESWDCQ